MTGHGAGPPTVQFDAISSVTFDDETTQHLPLETSLHQETGLRVGPRDSVRKVNSLFHGRRFSVDVSVVRRSLLIRDDNPPGPPPSSPPLSVGAIGGIIICVVLSILFILLGAFIWRRRERPQERPLSFGESIDIEAPKGSDHTLTGPVVHHTPSLPALPPLRIPSPSDSVMLSVSPIDSDSDGHGDRTMTDLSGDSGSRLILHGTRSDSDRGVSSIDLGSVRAGSSSRFVRGDLVDLKREQRSAVVSSMLYPPVMAFDGNPHVRQSLRPLPTPRITLHDNPQYHASLPDLRDVKIPIDDRVQNLRLDPNSGSFFAIANPDSPQGYDDDDLPDYDQATQMSASMPISPSSSRPPQSP